MSILIKKTTLEVLLLGKLPGSYKRPAFSFPIFYINWYPNSASAGSLAVNFLPPGNTLGALLGLILPLALALFAKTIWTIL